ncbi:MAG: Desulfoferrodoxin [Candidatus Jettenia ecosi]|uniref:Desulfoferrodoxin n=1 Tax=Candidatus Jettenia ecosi TaxID=2494326 RepID=A0A533QDC8_9BACT|nr:MAG: Desulfoferrodoxin [Candidatus Jettenia ecosi]
MAKKERTYFCEICRQKVVVIEEGFGVLVCCGKEMNLVKGMMATWTAAHHKPANGVTFVCNVCKQKIRVIEETTGILECCGQRMHREEAPDYNE